MADLQKDISSWFSVLVIVHMLEIEFWKPVPMAAKTTCG
jgi:hypothetical protein